MALQEVCIRDEGYCLSQRKCKRGSGDLANKCVLCLHNMTAYKTTTLDVVVREPDDLVNLCAGCSL